VSLLEQLRQYDMLICKLGLSEEIETYSSIIPDIKCLVKLISLIDSVNSPLLVPQTIRQYRPTDLGEDVLLN
jgi:hypothetical protein